MAESASVDEADFAGRAAGWVVGLIGGAKVGSVLIPFPIVGTFTGAVVGGVLGGGVGSFCANALMKGASTILKGASQVADGTSKSLKTASDAAK